MNIGSSHIFQLSIDEILYYCDFNNPKYKKEFVHQIHCGTTHGKSLVDYVVPLENRGSCFFFRKPINGFDILKELKRRRKLAIKTKEAPALEQRAAAPIDGTGR